MGRRRCSRSKRAEKKGKKRTALSTTVFYACVCKMIMFTRLLFFVRSFLHKKMNDASKRRYYRLLRAC